MKTLLLNASFEPIRVISVQRAIVLVVQEKADILEAGDGYYRSPSTAVPVPEVIKLRSFVQIPFRAKIPLTNRAVLVRDNFECAYCTKRKATTVDHVKPRARGGKHRWENVVAACGKCNWKKGHKLLSELPGWELRWEPYAPKGTFWLLLGVKERNPSWAQWLPEAGAVA